MKKMTTKDLVERYPDTFVSFLESKYRAKCSAWFYDGAMEKYIIHKTVFYYT